MVMTFTKNAYKFAQISMVISGISIAANSYAANWDLADEYGGSGDVVSSRASNKFISMVEDRIGDELTINYQGGGVLGYNSVDHIDAVEMGAIPSAITLITQLGGIDPIFNLSTLPFLAETPEEAYLLWQAAKPAYEKVFAERGQVILWAVPNPPSGIYANQPVTDKESLRSLRIRTYDSNGTKVFSNAGASPLQIAWSDLIPQLSTGGINSVLTSADSATALNLWDYSENFTEVNYAMGLFVMHVNKQEFESLSESTQQKIMEIVPEIEKYNWEMMQKTITNAYEKMDQNGMEVTLVDDIPSDFLSFLKKSSQPVIDDWIESAGSQGMEVLKEYESLKASENRE